MTGPISFRPNPGLTCSVSAPTLPTQSPQVQAPVRAKSAPPARRTPSPNVSTGSAPIDLKQEALQTAAAIVQAQPQQMVSRASQFSQLDLVPADITPLASNASTASSTAIPAAPLNTPAQLQKLETLDRTAVLKGLAQKLQPGAEFSQSRYESNEPFNTLSALTPNCKDLLVDPGVCSQKHLKAFEAFVQQRSQSPEGAFANAWTAREAFSESLGTETFYRAVTVTPEVMTGITEKGFHPSLYREMGASALDQQPSIVELTDQPIRKVVKSHLRDTSRYEGVANPYVDDFDGFKDKAAVRAFREQTTVKDQSTPRPKTVTGPEFTQKVEAFKSKARELSQLLGEKGTPIALKYKKNVDESLKKLENVSFQPFTDVNGSKLSALYGNVFTASREAVIRPELRRQDPLQSVTQIEDIAKSVAGNADYTGVTDANGKKTYLVTLKLPKLDVLNPLEYMNNQEFPATTITQYPGQDAVRHPLSERIEGLVMGSIPASAIQGQPVEITHPPGIEVES